MADLRSRRDKGDLSKERCKNFHLRDLVPLIFASLIVKVKNLNDEVKDLIKQLLNAYTAESMRIDLVLHSLASKPSPS